MLHFFTEGRCYTGHGISDDYQWRAKDLARKLRNQCFQGSSCIEGGNCQIFKGMDGEAKAIVGYSSVILTVLSLLEREIVAKHQSELDEYITLHPELSCFDSLRMARNFISAMNRVDQCPEKELTKEEESLWIESAQKIEALLAFAKQTIAQELEIPLERIAFVFHERFHIDMELFAGPNDCVFLHDEALMAEWKKKLPIPCSFLKNIYQYSESHLALNQKILEENTRILERIGCKVIRVPGVLTAEFEEGSISYSELINDWLGENVFLLKEDQEAQKDRMPKCVDLLNFMNGLFFSDPKPRWLSAGAPKGHAVTDFFKKAFEEAVQAYCPELQISFIRLVKLSTRLLMGSGGLRCLTSPL